MQELRKTGIDVLGEIPRGAHFCIFYETKQDLLDTIIPFFKAGLDNKEFCLWVISDSGVISLEEAKKALQQSIPDFDRHISDGNIEILDALNWYLEENVFNLERVINELDIIRKRTSALGFKGMRASGDASWLTEKYRKDFNAYEKQLNNFITDLQLTILCSYPLAITSGAEVLDVVRVHQFAIARRYGKWEVIETPELIQAKAEIKRLNEELERKVIERTLQLESTNNELLNEIDERKKAEDALRKSEDSIRLIINTIPIMAWSLRPDGLVDFVNQRWLDYVGERSVDDPIRIIHPEDISGVMEKWQMNKAAGKAYEDEMRLLDANREYRWFLVRTAPLYDEHGNIVKWYGVSTDIEDSKRAENALREREQQYLSLFENMAEGVAYFQMLFKDGKLQDAIYLEVNPAWEDLTGLRNVIGRKITEVLPGILEANSEFIERSVRVALTGQPERFEAYSTNLKKWLSTSAYCPKKEHVIVVFDDITERKLAEETLQQSYEEIRRLTGHLQKIREEERTHIAREIHDELGQQLTAIKMDVAWIDKRTPAETTDIKRKLKNIIGLLDGSNQSIRRILSELRPQILDDQGLLEAIEWLGRQFSENTGIPVKFTTPEKDIKVSEQIATSIFRLCQEAFTNITRHSTAKNISISIKIIKENIILIIEDDGKGFDAASVQNKKSFGILGMKERVLSLGGKFELFSSPGKGTKITVRLPYRHN